jgi:hypothetical protein
MSAWFATRRLSDAKVIREAAIEITAAAVLLDGNDWVKAQLADQLVLELFENCKVSDTKPGLGEHGFHSWIQKQFVRGRISLLRGN